MLRSLLINNSICHSFWICRKTWSVVSGLSIKQIHNFNADSESGDEMLAHENLCHIWTLWACFQCRRHCMFNCENLFFICMKVRARTSWKAQRGSFNNSRNFQTILKCAICQICSIHATMSLMHFFNGKKQNGLPTRRYINFAFFVSWIENAQCISSRMLFVLAHVIGIQKEKSFPCFVNTPQQTPICKPLVAILLDDKNGSFSFYVLIMIAIKRRIVPIFIRSGAEPKLNFTNVQHKLQTSQKTQKIIENLFSL